MASPLDLGALRREREARQAKKRTRSISPPDTPRKAPKIEAETITLPSGARLTSFTSVVDQDQKQRKSASAIAATARHSLLESTTLTPDTKASSTNNSATTLQYPDGVIKKTWAYKHSRTGDDIKLEEILEPNTLRTAVLSAFRWDLDWVFTKVKTPLNGGSTKCIFVMQAKEPALQAQMRRESAHMSQWLRLCFPPMEGQTRCMHSKLMLLFHEHKLRVAIPSANLLNFDWGETGSMENSVFLIDLPRLATPPKTSSQSATATDFQTELTFFLRKQGLAEDVIAGVQGFDFSKTSGMAFVHSIGGICSGPDADRSGLASLARAVRKHNLQNEDIELDFAASSIGHLQDAFLTIVHNAACGNDVFDATTKAGAKKAAQFFEQSVQKDYSIRDKMRVYFPTQDTVKASTAGAAGTICLSREWFEDTTFPRRCFRDYVSTRAGLLSHNKIMYARSPVSSAKKTAWLYHGSANMSESAWGKLVYNKKEKTWHVNCKNWECGVLLPVSEEKIATTKNNGAASGEKLIDMSVFDDKAKPPFVYPAPGYGSKEPWYFKEAGFNGAH